MSNETIPFFGWDHKRIAMLCGLVVLISLTITACGPTVTTAPAATPVPSMVTSVLPTATSVPPSDETFALVNGALIDGTGAAPLHDAALIIHKERIVAVGVRAQVKISDGAQVIDVQGATILPGLINAHVQDCNILTVLAQRKCVRMYLVRHV